MYIYIYNIVFSFYLAIFCLSLFIPLSPATESRVEAPNFTVVITSRQVYVGNSTTANCPEVQREHWGHWGQNWSSRNPTWSVDSAILVVAMIDHDWSTKRIPNLLVSLDFSVVNHPVIPISWPATARSTPSLLAWWSQRQGYPKHAGWFLLGKIPSFEMDDWGYPHLWKPPY